MSKTNEPEAPQRKESTGERLIREAIQSFPLTERLNGCRKRVAKMCSERRPPSITIPPMWSDDDMYICQTLDDALATIDRQREEITTLRARLAEMQRKVVEHCFPDEYEGYDDESDESIPYQSCVCCNGIWDESEPEHHDADCLYAECVAALTDQQEGE